VGFRWSATTALGRRRDWLRRLLVHAVIVLLNERLRHWRGRRQRVLAPPPPPSSHDSDELGRHACEACGDELDEDRVRGPKVIAGLRLNAVRDGVWLGKQIIVFYVNDPERILKHVSYKCCVLKFILEMCHVMNWISYYLYRTGSHRICFC
jgi:hypothetical protein